MESREKLIEKQKRINTYLALILKEHGISNVRLTSMGNSIGSGYSMVRSIKPLLLRNTSLEEILNELDISLDTHHFARAQNNSDEHMVEWLETNIKESEVHKMNRSDYSGEKTSMPAHIKQETVEELYPVDMKEDIGLKDAITEREDNLANIVVYNGATGSFLDGLTRHGSLKQQMLHGVKRDISNIESVMSIIQTNNRTGKSNTQVYLCGVPNLFGIGVSSIINRRLKRLAKKYANVVYVDPVKAKGRYTQIDDEGKDTDKKGIDIHYSEDEYLAFNNNIIEAINNNFATSTALIELDRQFYAFNKKMELEDKELVDDSSAKKEVISGLIRKEASKIKDDSDRKVFLKRLKEYIMGRFPYDFVYLGKKEVNSSIEEEHKKIR